MGRYSRKPTAPVEAKEFKNRSGHTIKPGERCIVMTTCTGHSQLYPATYIGMRGKNVVVEITDSRQQFVNDKDELYDFNKEYKLFPYAYFQSAYRYGTPEYKAGQEVWKETVDKPRAEGIAKLREGYAYKNFPFTRRSTLQNNNVFPADLALKDFQL